MSEVESEISKGKWPHPLMQYFCDLLPDRWAPSLSGIKPPTFEAFKPPKFPPDSHEMILQLAREARDAAYARQAHAEERAKGMRGETTVLIALGLALAGFLFGRTHHGWATVPAQVFAGGGMLFLVLAGIEALEVHLRVGLTYPPSLAEVLKDDVFSSYVAALEQDRRYVNWTASKKLRRLLQAQAWFSRGLLCLITAGLLTAVFVARADQQAGDKTVPKRPPATRQK